MEFWSALERGIFAEFADLSDGAALARVSVRVVLAAILGGVLGLERARHHKSAGLRTYMLVAVGSALFVVVPFQAGASAGEMTRVVQGVVAGIGFLGAGSILRSEHGESEHVSGLTTAAGIWMTAAIGVTAGMGQGATAVLSTAIAYVILSALRRVENAIESPRD